MSGEPAPQKTIPEMFRDQQGWQDRLVRSDKEKLAFRVRQQQELCTECGAPTVEVDIRLAQGQRICVQCLFNVVDDYESSIEDEMEAQEEIRDLSRHLDEATEEIDDLRNELDRAQRDITQTQDELAKAKELAQTISEECDALRARVEAFDDDALALQNQNQRLLLDIQELRRRNGSKG